MGIKTLDRLIGGIKLGDNVVWQIGNAVPIEHFIRSFFNRSNDFQNSIVYVSFNYAPHTVCRRFDDLFRDYNFTLIDAFTHGKGNGDQVFLDFYQGDGDYDLSRISCVLDPRDLASFTGTMNQIQEKNRDGSFYIFDSITGMNELWRDERAVLDFFAFACPKLYEMNTIAYWVLEQEAHSREFLTGLSHITQIVISVSNTGSDNYVLTIHKLEDRPSSHIGIPYGFRIIDREIIFDSAIEVDLFKIGAKVRDLRKAALITQAELAAKLGMTPGAVSQIENDLIMPSLSTLVHLSSIFKKPMDFFIGGSVPGEQGRGFHVFRRKDAHASSSRGAKILPLSDEGRGDVRSFSVVLGGGETIEGPILLHKGKELIIVVGGSLTLSIEGEEHLLRKGDSILCERSFVDRWSNFSKNECEFIYLQL